MAWHTRCWGCFLTAAYDALPGEEIAMEKDPVCGMDVNPRNAPAQSNFQGRTFYFCSEDCKQRFDREPHRYVAQPQPSTVRQTGGGTRQT